MDICSVMVDKQTIVSSLGALYFWPYAKLNLLNYYFYTMRVNIISCFIINLKKATLRYF